MRQREVVGEGMSGKRSGQCGTRIGGHDWRLILVRRVSGVDQCGLCYERFGSLLEGHLPRTASKGLLEPGGLDVTNRFRYSAE